MNGEKFVIQASVNGVSYWYTEDAKDWSWTSNRTIASKLGPGACGDAIGNVLRHLDLKKYKLKIVPVA